MFGLSKEEVSAMIDTAKRELVRELKQELLEELAVTVFATVENKMRDVSISLKSALSAEQEELARMFATLTQSLKDESINHQSNFEKDSATYFKNLETKILEVSGAMSQDVATITKEREALRDTFRNNLTEVAKDVSNLQVGLIRVVQLENRCLMAQSSADRANEAAIQALDFARELSTKAQNLMTMAERALQTVAAGEQTRLKVSQGMIDAAATHQETISHSQANLNQTLTHVGDLVEKITKVYEQQMQASTQTLIFAKQIANAVLGTEEVSVPAKKRVKR